MGEVAISASASRIKSSISVRQSCCVSEFWRDNSFVLSWARGVGNSASSTGTLNSSGLATGPGGKACTGGKLWRVADVRMGLSTGDGLNERKESVTVGRVCVCSDGSESRYRDELGESAKFMNVPFDKASVSESDSESLITTILDEHMFISAIQQIERRTLLKIDMILKVQSRLDSSH